MSAVEFLKAHPYQVAGGVFAVGLIGVFVLKGRNTAAPQPVVVTSGYDAGYNSSVAASNAQVVAAQVVSQAHAADTQASLQSHISDNATAVQVAQIAAGSTGDTVATAFQVASLKSAIDLASVQNARDVALAQITTAGDVALGTANLQASTSIQTAQLQASTSIQTAQLQAGVLTTQAGASVQIADLSSQAAQHQTDVAAQTAQFVNNNATNVSLSNIGLALHANVSDWQALEDTGRTVTGANQGLK